jgi:hypothetical protein
MRSLAWFLLAVTAGCVSDPQSTDAPTLSDTSPTSDCRPEFPDQDGWLGADAAYSVPLEPGKSLWLFGDTFVADSSITNRSVAKFVRNSIGVSTCDPSDGWRIKYHWAGQGSASPRAFFDSETEEYWYWPLDGFAHDGSVYVALAIMRDKPEERLFSFESIGVHLVKVSGLAEPPRDWRFDYRALVEGPTVSPGSSIVLNEGHVYLFSLYDEPVEQARHMILGRLPTKGLDSPAAHLEYFAKDRTWKAGLNANDALAVIEPGHSEMSVRHNEEIDKWVAVSDGGFLSDRIMLRTSAELTGPWSKWRPVHRFSEMSPTHPLYDRDTWCYAVKEHVEFSGGGSILVTYACNSVELHKQIADPAIYRPQAVLIDLASHRDE